jgi:hypothetical protein
MNSRRRIGHASLRRQLIPAGDALEQGTSGSQLSDLKELFAALHESGIDPSRRFHNSAQVRCWSNRTWPPGLNSIRERDQDDAGAALQDCFEHRIPAQSYSWAALRDVRQTSRMPASSKVTNDRAEILVGLGFRRRPSFIG